MEEERGDGLKRRMEMLGVISSERRKRKKESQGEARQGAGGRKDTVPCVQ